MKNSPMEQHDFYISSIIEAQDCRENKFMTEIDIESILRYAVAMANDKGGNVIVGIDSARNVIGIDYTSGQIKQLQQTIQHRIAPQLPYHLIQTKYQGKSIMVINVWDGSTKPYLLDSSAYTFVGDQLIIADNHLIGLLFDKRALHDRSWEREFVYSATIDDLDMERVKAVRLQSAFRRPQYADYTEEKFLQEQGLLITGVPTNACVLLFAKNTPQFIPQSRIRLSVYSDTPETRELLQVQIFEGNFFDNLEQITRVVKSIYGTKVLVDGIYRHETSLLPEVIFREALLNAMVHRDYSAHRSFLNITISSQELKITSFGKLLEGISIPALFSEHNSVLRNPDIANICYLVNLIEIAGSGTLRILSESRLYPGLLPEWQEADGIITLTLKGLQHKSQTGLSKHRLQVSNEATQYTLDTIISYIEKTPGCKLTQIQDVIGKSLATTKRYVQLLRENGIIEYIGSPKTGGYKLNK